MAGSGGGSGLFSVAWGVWATGFGWIVATDFRGAAHRFHSLSQRSVPFGGAGRHLSVSAFSGSWPVCSP